MSAGSNLRATGLRATSYARSEPVGTAMPHRVQPRKSARVLILCECNELHFSGRNLGCLGAAAPATQQPVFRMM